MSTNMEESTKELGRHLTHLEDSNKSYIESAIKSAEEFYNKLLTHKENLEKRKKGYKSYSEEMKKSFDDLKKSLRPMTSIIKSLEIDSKSKEKNVSEVAKSAWTSFDDFYNYLMNLFKEYKNLRKIKKYGDSSEKILTLKDCITSLATIEGRFDKLSKSLEKERKIEREENSKKENEKEKIANEIKRSAIFLNDYVKNGNDFLNNSQKRLPKNFGQYDKFCSKSIKQLNDTKELITGDIIPKMEEISKDIQSTKFAVDLKEKDQLLTRTKQKLSKLNMNLDSIKNEKSPRTIFTVNSLLNFMQDTYQAMWRYFGY